MQQPHIFPFFDAPTFTYSYVVADPVSRRCAIIDSVLEFDLASGRTQTVAADRIIALVTAHGFAVDWIFETHVHADHLSAAPYLQARLGGRLAIGAQVTAVQHSFAEIFNVEPGFRRDGGQFDLLFDDGAMFAVGDIGARALHTPGHTPACMTYLIGDAAFVGDTLFMPDYGTARCDFPGGDARTLYRSIRRVLDLPPQTRMFLCHDYLAPGRDQFACETTVAAQRAGNVHVHDGIGEEAFVAMRVARDAQLEMPRLILPSVQVNMRAGHFPPAEANGISYLKLPLNAL